MPARRPAATREYLIEVRLQPEDVECRKGEDGTCNYNARAGADGLYDDVLSQHVLLAEGGADAYGDDGDGYGGLEHLSHLETEECRRGREYHGHDYAIVTE